jgi:Ca2+-binding RTX toxin-like protein
MAPQLPRSHRFSRRAGLTAFVLALALLLANIASVRAVEIGTNDFRISDMGPANTAGFEAFRSKIAYNPATDQYLVVWQGDEEGAHADGIQAEIYGQLINARTGAEVGTNDFLIARIGTAGDGETDATDPAVAYNSVNNEFVVVFAGDNATDATTATTIDTFEIYAQRVSSTGALVGGQLRVSDLGALDTNGNFDALVPEIAYNSASNEFLVVWHGDDDTAPLINNELEIFGQRLGYSAGNLVEIGTNDFRISDMGTDGVGTFDARNPSVVYNTVGNEYLVAWEGNDAAPQPSGPFQVFGQRISAAGAEVGTNDFLIGSSGDEAFSPELAYNSTNNEYLVVWEGDGGDGTAGTANVFEVWGQRLNASGAEIGGDFEISDAGPAGNGSFVAQTPAAAYVEGLNQYLVVWKSDDTAAGDFEVYFSRLSNTGTAIESEVKLSAAGGNAVQTPDVAWSESAVNSYLVVWAGEYTPVLAAGESEIFGQLNTFSSNLQITKSASPANPAPGGSVTYTLNYSNAGPDTALSVVITDTIPAQLTGCTFSTSGVTGSAPVLRSGTTFIWDVAQLGNGQGGTITITCTVGASVANGTVIGNTASIGTAGVAVDTNTANNSQTANVTVVAPPTNTPTATATPSNTPTPSHTPTATATPSNTPSITPTPSNTPTETTTPSITATPSNTPTETVTPTDTATPTATNTPSNTPTDTATPTATNTPTDTATPTATNTPSNTPTDTATPTATNTPTDTATPTNTATPSNTPTNTATPTNTPTPSNTPTPTNTPTNTPIPNRAPVASNDSYNTNEDTVLTVPAPGVLGNDSDADFDPLTAVLVSNPSNGTLTLNPNGSFTYTPNANFNGGDSFTYRASDGSLQSNVATVTINVVAQNDPPNLVYLPLIGACPAGNGTSGISVFFSGSDIDTASLTGAVSPTSGTGLASAVVSAVAGQPGVFRLDLSVTPGATVRKLALTLSVSDGALNATFPVQLIVGTSGDDRGQTPQRSLSGSSNADIIIALGGNDVSHAGGGDDLVCGGTGNDLLYGQDGRDALWAGDGNDIAEGGNHDDAIDGGAGNDTLLAGAGNDIVNAGAGNDIVDGNAGNDTINGQAGNDQLNGDAGEDIISGGEDNDAINGGDQNDTLNGNDGNDNLTGGAGNDVLVGGAGNDSLAGFAGNDTLTGNAGTDTFDGGTGTDTATDANTGAPDFDLVFNIP